MQTILLCNESPHLSIFCSQLEYDQEVVKRYWQNDSEWNYYITIFAKRLANNKEYWIISYDDTNCKFIEFIDLITDNGFIVRNDRTRFDGGLMNVWPKRKIQGVDTINDIHDRRSLQND